MPMLVSMMNIFKGLYKMIDKSESLLPDVLKIMKQQATEAPGTSPYISPAATGLYFCRCCGLALFDSQDQFTSHCGWPSFDDCIKDHVLERPDKDGQRVEIICRDCKSHLGHVFKNEGFSAKNTRHCVNGLALDYSLKSAMQSEEIILAGGCFWGVEHFMQQAPGVLKTEVGYIGGSVLHPSYQDVLSKKTGHYEAVRVLFDPSVTSCEEILKLFFQIHDPTQVSGQGPDLGPQYQSAIFYHHLLQKSCAENVMGLLESQGLILATQLFSAQVFWPAEDYHQQYYQNQQQTPYCHQFIKRF